MGVEDVEVAVQCISIHILYIYTSLSINLRKKVQLIGNFKDGSSKKSILR